ncbi:MAG: glycerophosphodiester phosphodiesterase [Planctomycetota bacterium]
MAGPALIVGHRGAPVERLENTLPSFERALALGCQGLELDVQLTRDQQVVVMHDADLARITSGRDRRQLQDLTLAELEQVALCCEVRPPHGAAVTLEGRPPRLSQVLALAAAHAARVAVEIKWEHGGDPTPIVEAVARELIQQPTERVTIISFSRGVVRMLCRRRLTEQFGWIRSRPLDRERLAFLREIDPPMLVLKKTLATPELLASVMRPGREVWVYSLNDAADVARFKGLPVQGYIADDPAELLRLRRAGQC